MRINRECSTSLFSLVVIEEGLKKEWQWECLI